MMKRGYPIVFLSIVFWLSGLAVVQAEYEHAGRVSDLTGRIFFQSGRSLDWQEGFVNSPVLEGDRIWSDIGSFAELQVNNGRYVRLGEDTKLDVLDARSDRFTAKLWLGSMYVRLTLDPDRAFPVYIETSDGTFQLLTKGLFRFDVVSSNETQLRIFDGVAEIRSGSQSLSLRSGEMIVIQSGTFPGTISRFSLSERDALGGYNDDRDKFLIDSTSSRYMDDSLTVGSAELDYHGTWVYDASYGYCWRPQVAVGWVPYRFGRWSWIFPWGWTWISFEPWGWLPYHYGYWYYSSFNGWIWYPDQYFAPAWVVWTAHSGSVGWVPIHPDDVRHTHWNANNHNSQHIIASIGSPLNASLHIGIQAGTHILRSDLEAGKLIRTNNDLVRMSRGEVTQWQGAPPADIKPARQAHVSVPSERLQSGSRAKTWNERDSRSTVTSDTWRQAVTDHRTTRDRDVEREPANDRRTTTPSSRDSRPDTRDSRPDVRDSRPDTRDSRPDTRDSRPDTRDSRPDARDSRPDTRDSRPDVRDSRTDTRSSRSDVRSDSPSSRGTSSDTRSTTRESQTSPSSKPAEKSWPTYRQPYERTESTPRNVGPSQSNSSSRPSTSPSVRPSPSNDRSPARPSSAPSQPSVKPSSSSSRPSGQSVKPSGSSSPTSGTSKPKSSSSSSKPSGKSSSSSTKSDSSSTHRSR